jgi:hypothetical protein
LPWALQLSHCPEDLDHVAPFWWRHWPFDWRSQGRKPKDQSMRCPSVCHFNWAILFIAMGKRLALRCPCYSSIT